MRLQSICITLVTAGLALAQSDVIQLRLPPPPPGNPAARQDMIFNTTTDASFGPVEFVRSEFASEAAVKGAPYSAEATTESVQLLQDGNRIVHRDATTLARDTEGRTRRDMTMPLIPGMSASEAPKFSFLFDPVTDTSYTLDHTSRIARRSAGRAFSIQYDSKPSGPMPGVMAGRSEARGIGAETGLLTEIRHDGGMNAGTAGATVIARTRSSQSAGKTESLGKQTLEGVVVEGTRTVSIIPIGEIGNERPIEVVSERWYSPELQTVVMSKHSDPRQGETTYKLTNIRRAEPPKSLFEVPSGYNVEAMGDRMIRMRDSFPKE